MSYHVHVLTNESFSTGTIFVTIPLCPDLLTIDHLGEADNLRGRTIRAFFRLMRWWPT